MPVVALSEGGTAPMQAAHTSGQFPAVRVAEDDLPIVLLRACWGLTSHIVLFPGVDMIHVSPLSSASTPMLIQPELAGS